MKAIKKIIFILSVFCIALPASGMRVSSLQSKCIKAIARNFKECSIEDIAQLPEVHRNALVIKEIIESLGVMRCNPHSYFGITRLAQTQRRGTGPVYAAAATLDNKIIVGTYDHVYVWGIDGEKLAIGKGHTSAISSVAVTKDNKIISGSFDKTIRIWDIDGNQRTILEGHSDAVTAVAVSHDNKIISGSGDNTLRIWNMDGSNQAICIGHTGPISAIAISQDNKIISASRDKTIRVWDIEGNQRAVFKGDINSLIAVTPDNKIIVKDSRAGSMFVWDIDGNFQRELYLYLPSSAARLAVTHDNKIVFACRDGNAYIYDRDCNQLAMCTVSIFGDDKNISALAVTQDNKIILGCLDHTGCVFDMDFLKRLENINVEQTVRILSVVRNSSGNNGRKWEMIKKIVKEPDSNEEMSSENDGNEEARSVPVFAQQVITLLQIRVSASNYEVDCKLPERQAGSLNLNQKFALACVIGLAGCIAYKLFVRSSE